MDEDLNVISGVTLTLSDNYRLPSGLEVARNALIWQYADEPVRLWSGEFLLDARNMVGSATYKLRVYCSQEHREHWSSGSGKGTISAEKYQFVNFVVPDAALPNCKLKLFVNDLPLVIGVEKVKNADNFIWKSTEISLPPSIPRQLSLTVPRSPAPLIDLCDPFANISEEMRKYLLGSDPTLTRQRIFTMIHPIVMECMVEIGVYQRDRFMKEENFDENVKRTRPVNKEMGGFGAPNFSQYVLQKLAVRLREQRG